MAAPQAGITTIAGLSPSLSGACSLPALVIAKQDPRVMPSKRVLLQSPVVVIRQPTDVDENYRPHATSPFSLKLSENSSAVTLFEGDDLQYRQLFSLPHSRLVMPRRVCQPRDVSTRQGRQLQSCELRLMDPSCASFGLQLWDSEWIRLAQQWTPWETVLYVTDCRVKYDTYRQTAVGVVSSQTVLTPNPALPAAQQLAQFARRVRAERAQQFTADEEFDVSAVKDHCSVLELEQRLLALTDVTASHVVLVPAFVTWLPLDSDRYKITKW
ncbi:meiosis-specific with OB domain-containing protein-like [Pollicipes pollicipes]|uniref:meiosis-specific with OB domain-containing protein-like n=1 Tax=Pollicipes pollicipes TaxID=41117 RepID=UPI0018850241|nr:meiosis-specific with OB domain-containing protein-like [Pollicipes pollicipes]